MTIKITKNPIYDMEATCLDSQKTRMFLSEVNASKNIQTFHKPRYKWLLDRCEEMRSLGNWSKFEIDLSGEYQDYISLSDTQKYIYTSGLKFAIALDSCAGRGILELFNSKISNNPELELWLNLHQTNELLHAESYTELIKAVYDNTDEFLDSINFDEKVVTRAADLLSNFDWSVEVLARHDANETAEFNGRDIPFPEITETILRQSIYKSLLHVNIFEGIRFFTTFVTAWAFNELPKKKMQGSGNLFKLIARDEMIHLGVFQSIIRLLKTDESEGFVEVIKGLENYTYDTFKSAYDSEMEWIDSLFYKGSDITGLTAELLKEYVTFLFNIRMANLLLDPAKINIKKVDKSPIPWVDNYLSSEHVKVAPQELESTQYVSAINMNGSSAVIDMGEL